MYADPAGQPFCLVSVPELSSARSCLRPGGHRLAESVPVRDRHAERDQCGDAATGKDLEHHCGSSLGLGGATSGTPSELRRGDWGAAVENTCITKEAQQLWLAFLDRRQIGMSGLG